MADPSFVRTMSQKVTIGGVTDVVATEIVADNVNGGFVRSLRFYGEPAGALVLEVEIRSADAADLRLATPEFEF